MLKCNQVFGMSIICFLLSCADNNKIENESVSNPEQFAPIYFTKNSAAITPDYFMRLDSIGSYLKTHPNSSYLAIGSAHPTEIGYENEEIAFKRVQNVYSYLNFEFNIPKPEFISTRIINSSINKTNHEPLFESEYMKVIIEIKN